MAMMPNSKSEKWGVQMERLFKACADQTRLRILNMLIGEGEICVRHFVEVLQTSQPKVSRHLAYLKRAGFITDRKDGLWVYYRLASPLAVQAERILACLESCCGETPEMQQDLSRLQMILNDQSSVRVLAQRTESAAFIAREPEEMSEIRVELL